VLGVFVKFISCNENILQKFHRVKYFSLKIIKSIIFSRQGGRVGMTTIQRKNRDVRLRRLAHPLIAGFLAFSESHIACN
jgi:hypothetical protein